jgi:hypothetical protein
MISAGRCDARPSVVSHLILILSDRLQSQAWLVAGARDDRLVADL